MSVLQLAQDYKTIKDQVVCSEACPLGFDFTMGC
jgi:hypothetical protein